MLSQELSTSVQSQQEALAILRETTNISWALEKLSQKGLWVGQVLKILSQDERITPDDAEQALAYKVLQRRHQALDALIYLYKEQVLTGVSFRKIINLVEASSKTLETDYELSKIQHKIDKRETGFDGGYRFTITLSNLTTAGLPDGKYKVKGTFSATAEQPQVGWTEADASIMAGRTITVKNGETKIYIRRNRMNSHSQVTAHLTFLKDEQVIGGLSFSE